MARQPLKETFRNRERTSVEEPRKRLKLDDLEAMLAINEHQLEEEWQKQPDCYYKVKKELAYAMSERDDAYKAVKEAEAEAETFIREDAAEKEEKITDKAVEAQRRLDKNVLQAQDKHSELSLRVGLIEALVGAFSHRRDALENLVKLYLADYYGSGEHSGATNGQVRDVMADRARKAQREMRRK